MRNVLLHGALIALCSSIVASARAEQPDQRLLSLQDALRLGLQQHPQLTQFTLRAQALAGDQESAALSPPLRLSAELENIAGSGAFQETQNAELTLSLSSVIEPRYQRDARQAIVTARQQALATEENVFALDLLTEITRGFIAVVAAQELLSIHKQSHQLWQRRVTDLQKRVAAGRSPAAELLRAQAALARADIARLDAENTVLLAKMSLSKLWGEPDDFHFTAQGNLHNLGAPASREHILSLLDQHPDLRLLADETRLRTAELNLARSRSSLTPEWQAGLRHIRESDDTALVLGISVPLSSRARASGEIKTARAQQQLAMQQQDSAILELRSLLLQLGEQQQLALQRAKILRDEIVPLLSRALTEADDAFARGRYSYMEWSLVQNELLDAQLELIQSAAQAHYWRTEIDRLSGAILFNDDPSPSKQGVMP